MQKKILICKKLKNYFLHIKSEIFKNNYICLIDSLCIYLVRYRVKDIQCY